MRGTACALLPAAACLLLALRSPSAASAAPSTATEPTGLLILRTACRLRDPGAFDPSRLQQVADSLGRAPLIANYQLLEYKETCESSWENAVAQASLAVVGQGGAVTSAGWVGRRTCGLLWGAKGKAPMACAAPAARAALAATLAERLAWRRALLLRVEEYGTSECAATLRATRRALLAKGVTVHYVAFSLDALSRDSHVVIACATPAMQVALRQLRAAVLLLHTLSDDAMMSNITLDVGNSPYVRNVDISKFSLDYTMAVENTSYFLNSTRNDSKVNDTSGEAKAGPGEDKAILMKKDVYNIKKGNFEDKTSEKHNVASEDKLPRFLVTDTRLKSSRNLLENVLRHAILEAFDNDDDNEQKANLIFYLLENVHESNLWREVAVFKTVVTQQIDQDEWSVRVEETNTTEWEVWRAARSPARAQWERGVDALWVAAGVCGVLAAGAVAAVARAVLRRRRGARRRGDVVLTAADFTFPADEARRVPDGMETMLSCWLQQLHEFGGPTPCAPRPDLLSPAPLPPAAPAPPSAPSSTASASASRLALDRRTRYKGDAVQLKQLPLPDGATDLELRRKATDVLIVLHSLRHENLNPFIGCLCETRPSLVWDHCGRGSLEDVLVADEIKLDWTFRLSLLTDLVRGLRYLHASPLRVHGYLSSRNCVVDSRWVLRLTDYGLPDFYRAQGLTPPPRRARDLLWTAPELLRIGEGAQGTQLGDVFSFAIIMQEVIVRGEPYCMLALSPEEIVEKLCRPPPLIRPSVSMGAAPPEAVSVMRQCWAEAPELRPSTDALADIFRLLHRGRKVNIVDSMFQMLEKYSNNLEELIKERTDQLDMEKKKTEQLLNRMLPRSVAERLLLGLSVEPEEFEEVSIYFSDIVGFTAIAARSTPVQVVALLNDLYTTFDAAIEQYKVYKVETIGDAYMVVGGLPVRCSEHAESVATMALHLLHLAGRFRIRHLPAAPLHLRIGLHSGPCCAGVVGLTMPRYCLFGDTVNTASRMESTGAAWRIQVSEAIAARLQAARGGGYRLRSRGLRHVKGKGLMHTYWLLGKDGFDRPLPTPPPLPLQDTLLEHEAESEASPPLPSPATAPAPPSQLPVLPNDKYAWQRQRSGAVSADSSPPAAPYARYRCLGGGRALRRQWSLERGEALAEARAVSRPPAPAAAPAVSVPSASRYRTRPAPDAPTVPPSASFD